MPAFWPSPIGGNRRDATDTDQSHPQLPGRQVQLVWEGPEGESQVP
ncbi:rCG25753, isoform CRA_d [Rattus norvegicus]|uniref:RCG25753, isoform CRA_d n=1 Tax=Rattus norvegicus TaxID=10116 RepID=A6I1I4_RAT|nr:rCG25753, isoform CRA_d [Rattus norvegicus]